MSNHAFSAAEQRAVYRAIAERRDMRRFVPGAEVPEDVLARLLHAAHAAPTIAFMTLALAQIAHLGNARSRGPVLRLRRALANPHAIVGAGIAVLLQLAAAAIDPLARVLRVTPLEPIDWLVIVALAAVPAVVGQMLKALGQRETE